MLDLFESLDIGRRCFRFVVHQATAWRRPRIVTSQLERCLIRAFLLSLIR